MDRWLDTDEQSDVLNTLVACRNFVQTCRHNSSYWKWVFIGFHNLVQGAMVVALRRSDGFGPIEKKIESKWYKAYRDQEKLEVEMRLLGFFELYKAIKSPGNIQSPEVDKYTPPGDQDDAMERLALIRNDFMHFTPGGWSIELSGAPELCLTVLDIPEFLIRTCPGFILFQEITRESYQGFIQELKQDLQSLATHLG